MQEAELARLCARGDAKAREELYRTYSPRLLALCMRYAADRDSAEDLMQDAFIKIFRVIRKFRWERQGSLYSWMARVTLNLCFDSMKKRRRLAALIRDDSGLEDGIQAALPGRPVAQGDSLDARDQGEQRILQPFKGKGDFGKED